MTEVILFTAGIAFVITLILGPFTIRCLRLVKFGQNVREAGPARHSQKAGTPTMGGVLIVFSFCLAFFLVAQQPGPETWVLITGVGFGIIGFADDLIMIIGKRSLGLKARHKLAGEIALATVFALHLWNSDCPGIRLLLPFADGAVNIGPVIFFPLAVFTIVGTANAVNLTDGLDGLAAGAVGIAAAAYVMIGLHLGVNNLVLLSAAVSGACLGFSWFNSHPAQVFMGDTGALSLGAILGAMAVLTGTELTLVLVGALFVLETLSVIMQVIYFRLTGGRRIFRMTPLHHHFELAGWSEPKVVMRFWIVAMVSGAIGVISLPPLQ